MERYSTTLRKQLPRLLACVCGLALLGLPSGCVLTGKGPFAGSSTKPAPAPEFFEAIWSKQVQYLPDPTRNGQPGPVLACRVYFFGNSQSGETVTADGTLKIDLYDDSNRAQGAVPRHLEQWTFPSVVLQKMLLRDSMLGQGYTVGMPWTSFRPDVAQVHLVMQFEPAGGGQVLMNTSEVITLDGGRGGTGPVQQAGLKTVGH